MGHLKLSEGAFPYDINIFFNRLTCTSLSLVSSYKNNNPFVCAVIFIEAHCRGVSSPNQGPTGVGPLFVCLARDSPEKPHMCPEQKPPMATRLFWALLWAFPFASDTRLNDVKAYNVVSSKSYKRQFQTNLG